MFRSPPFMPGPLRVSCLSERWGVCCVFILKRAHGGKKPANVDAKSLFPRIVQRANVTMWLFFLPEQNVKFILRATGKSDRNRASHERRRRMGLFKRGKVWWMSVNYQGKQVRKSTETTDRRLAEAILGKVLVSIVEGKFFDKLQEQERTVKEMIERYFEERGDTLSTARALRNT